ncbi:transporter substrate-binding domain-containing protein [Falsirhodobacter xinxiangensis]|uniref:transporter substrate-binding domain-containing protein n=1 Tax=Falsirhodobacter xinxiangensis TaxID=2530049 RepID=UPI0010AB2B09|nr:transporter substrate-binding domain-containing protein [Rhodobacter xinxiangensis]
MKTAILTAAALLIAAAAHAETTLERIRERGAIRIAIDLSVPPWSYKDENLVPVGSEVETAQLLADSLGVDMEIVQTNGANRIPFLMSGQADIIMSVLSITDERRQVIDFSRPYTGASTFIAAPAGAKIASAEDLAGQRIAVTRGTANDTDLTALAPARTEIIRFEDEATTITAVAAGQVPLVAQAQSLIDVINARNPSLQLEPKITLREFRAGVGIRKGDTDLAEYLDEWIGDNVENGKIGAIYAKYQHADLPADIVTYAD